MPQTKQRRNAKVEEVPVEEARTNMKDLLNRVEFGGERIIVTRYNKKSVALVSLADLEKIEKAVA